MLTLYKSLIRPILDYASPAWSPYLIKDIENLENVQRRFTRMIPEYSRLSQYDRQKNLKLTTLEERCRRSDLLELFKMMKNITKHDPFKHVQRSITTNTRGHTLKLQHQFSKTNLRRNSFFVRVIKDWNRLPQEAIDSNTVNTFKGHLQKYLQTPRARSELKYKPSHSLRPVTRH